MMGLYAAATTLALPLINRALRQRVAAGKEIAGRLGERRGIAGLARPAGPLIWIHGASLGEAMSTLALIDALQTRRADLSVLVTTGTVTSAHVLADRLPPRAMHQFAPLDHRPWVRCFLDHWQPDMAIWIESELWPALLTETARRNIPMFLLNGRMSPRSTRRWRWGGVLTRRLLSRFSVIQAQDPDAAERFRRLGAHQVSVGGNLKLAAAPLPVDTAALAVARDAIGQRPVLVAASTHPGEELRLAAIHRALTPRHPGLLTILAPRHPARGAAVLAELAAAGYAAGLRSRGDGIADHELYIADTLGELGLFYRLAEITVVGGTLAPIGGHNPLEAGRLGCAIVIGPHTSRQHDTVTRLLAAGGALQAGDDTALEQHIGHLLSDPQARSALARQAALIADDAGRALDLALVALQPYLHHLDTPGGTDAHHANA